MKVIAFLTEYTVVERIIFLDLWKDADPIFQEIEDTKRLLDELLAK